MLWRFQNRLRFEDLATVANLRYPTLNGHSIFGAAAFSSILPMTKVVAKLGLPPWWDEFA